MVTGPREIEVDAARMALLRVRLMAVTATAHVDALLREAAG